MSGRDNYFRIIKEGDKAGAKRPPCLTIGSGTGLGLDIARRFVDLNDGDLEFTSKPGHTVFRVRLPIAGTKAHAQRGA